jgi:Domain of unknown function (DUF4157)/Heterokaryon incompatibility protein Het-C
MRPLIQKSNESAGFLAKKSFFNHQTGSNAVVQTKLTVGSANDAHEHEANRTADMVMRKPLGQIDGVTRSHPVNSTPTITPVIQRACAHCENEKEQTAQRKETSATSGGFTAPPSVSRAISRGGSGLDSNAKTFMESRFNCSFDNVRVHTDGESAASARDISARAYTSGNHIVFGDGQYQPNTEGGRHLLAHELTHTVQQGNSSSPNIARFTDTIHHVVEDYAFDNAGLSEVAIAEINQANVPERVAQVMTRYNLTNDQIVAIQHAHISGALKLGSSQREAIHEGNTERDYSQVPKVANLALRGNFSNYNNYDAREHFDNFIYEMSTQQWRNRGADSVSGSQVATRQVSSPTDYIREQITLLNDNWDSPNITEHNKLKHVGNAFHTIEDFFAHSNFVELLQKDYQHGTSLITANPVGPSDSEDNILASVTPPEMSAFYQQRADITHQQSAPGTHTRMAKDHPGAHNFKIARRLAALAIQSLTTDLLIAFKVSDKKARQDLLDTTFFVKVKQYLQPPSTDAWWDKALLGRSTETVDSGLDRVQTQTPVTVNQAVFSPLRNMEASKQSSMRMPLGVAIPIKTGGNPLWFQVGAGIAVQNNQFENSTVQQGNFIVGAQATGHF